MAKRRVKQTADPVWKLPDSGVVESVLGKMAAAIPAIVKRVEEREALTAESRFEVPKVARPTTLEDDS